MAGRTRKSSVEILAEISAVDDGLPTRPIGTWSLEKLAIVHLYLHGFTAASEKAAGGVYVDGFAGPGMCRVRGASADPEFVWGSPLLSLRTDPSFASCLLVELDRGAVNTLEARITEFGGKGTVYSGDANAVVPELLRSRVERHAPAFCLLDPEGTELLWATVRSIALTPGRRRKPELLMLFPSASLLRLLPKQGVPNPTHESILDRLMPTTEWRDVYQARRANRITPSDAKERYVELYRQGLEDLGYSAFSHIIQAPSKPGGKRQERYRLVFATEHEAGERIMLDVFRRPYVLDFPVSSQPPLFE
jgi:three-Cys-motif partner protein